RVLCKMATECTNHLFFFFSSRRRHTRFSRDWSSDVCSSDLLDYSKGLLVRREALEESISVVQTIDADDELASVQAVDHLAHGLRPVCPRCFLAYAVDIHPDGKHTALNRAIADPDAVVGVDVCLRNALFDGRVKRHQVALCLETDEVVRCEVAHELRVRRQDTQGFDVWKRNVQEEPERRTHSVLAQEACERH